MLLIVVEHLVTVNLGFRRLLTAQPVQVITLLTLLIHEFRYVFKYTGSLIRISISIFFIDNNECLVINGGCDMLCVNEEGGYKCDCYPGFERNGNGTACVG